MKLELWFFFSNIVVLIYSHSSHKISDQTQFNGITDFLILDHTPSVAMYEITQSLSIEIILAVSETGRQHSLVESYGCSMGDSGGFFMRIEENDLLCVGILNHCTDYTKYCGHTQIQPNVVYHLGFTYNNGRIAIFINGTYDFNTPTDTEEFSFYSR